MMVKSQFSGYKSLFIFGMCITGNKATPTSPPIFPVIVYSHGLRTMRTTYSAITCDLASHGYVVAAVEHRYVCVLSQVYPSSQVVVPI